MTRDIAENADRTYQLHVISEFDPNDRGLPPGEIDDKLKFAADHSGLPGETWQLVDPLTDEVIFEYEI